jgi:hypothetical protein
MAIRDIAGCCCAIDDSRSAIESWGQIASSSRFKALRANLKVVSSSARAGAGMSTFCLTRAQSYSILTRAS